MLGGASASVAAPFTDHFVPLDAALGELQLELAASPDPREQRAACSRPRRTGSVVTRASPRS